MVAVESRRAAFALATALVSACGPTIREPCLEADWVRTASERSTFCGVAVLPNGEFAVYSNAYQHPTLLIFDADGVQLAEREVPNLEQSASCVSLAADPSGGWWMTAAQFPTDTFIPYSSLHRLTDRDASFADLSTRREEGAVLSSVVATPGGALLGGYRPSPSDGAFRAITTTVDAQLVEQARWASEDLGSIGHLESVGDIAVGLAKVPSIDYGDAFLLRLDADSGVPSLSVEAGTLGDQRDAIQSVATTRDTVLLFKTSREVVPGSPPPDPGNPSTYPPLQSRSVVEARGLHGDVLWEHVRVDEHVDHASVAADDEYVLAWRGAGPSFPETEGLAVSEFDVLGAEGGCRCAVESPVRGRIVDVVALNGQPPGSFLVVSEVDETLELTRVRVSPR